MSSAPTNASSWVRSRLTSLYEATDASLFLGAFDQAFSLTCEVRLDHAPRPLQALRDELASRQAAATHASVAWSPDVIATNDDPPEEPAVVAGALVVTRLLPFRIRAGPAQRLTHVHFSAKVEQDANVQGDDRRRITSFYYTVVNRTPPIYFTVPRAAKEDQPDGE